MASRMAAWLQKKFYGTYIHPNRELRGRVEKLLDPEMVLLDAGCGREAPSLKHFVGKARQLIGIDLVTPRNIPPQIQYVCRSLDDTGIPDGSVDLIYSQAVFEHLQNPDSVLREMRRMLKDNGRVIVLTPNKFDYGSLFAMAVPNKFHPFLVEKTEGRDREDTFPTFYKCNTESEIRKLAKLAGLDAEEIVFINQYPNYFLFSGPLFFLGMLYERLTSRFDSLRRLRGWIIFTLRRR